MRRIIAVAAFLALAGCAAPVVQMYEGQTRAPSDQVIVRVESRGQTFAGEWVDIQQVDDQPTLKKAQGFLSGSSGAQAVYLLPGKHTLRLRYRARGAEVTANLWFVAEAGNSYLIKAGQTGDGLKVWIEDEKTAKPVGGVRGSADEPK
ncbi:MAG: hypothetical protein QOD26_1182 [Betaproteobacteria bacterium]|jgi:hypothetical protein|nr:hypothetical protein [Betaproteobacteria bacterium]